MEPSTIPLTRAQMTHMARFAFEALGIELMGQPDTSANKANEKKSRTMKKLLAHHTGSLMKRLLIGSLAAAAVVLGVAPVAHAGLILDDAQLDRA